ncbi:MAG: flavin reductase family protein [Proteobacteria bacterium]|nr:flavin reductase family protein [Pseudomonadota bacterium]
MEPPLNSIQDLFQRLTLGVYVIGVVNGETRNAFTAACVMQASYDPLLLALSINRLHSCYGTLRRGQAFSVNVLKTGQLDLAAHYGRPARDDKLASTSWMTGITGAPLLRAALAWFECEAVAEYPAGDHVLVVGKVIGGEVLDSVAEPMSYRETGDLDGASTLYPARFEPK